MLELFGYDVKGDFPTDRSWFQDNSPLGTISHWIRIKPIYCPPGPRSPGQLPTGDNSPLDKDKAHLLPTRTTRPRVQLSHWIRIIAHFIAHQDHDPQDNSPLDKDKAHSLVAHQDHDPQDNSHWIRIKNPSIAHQDHDPQAQFPIG